LWGCGQPATWIATVPYGDITIVYVLSVQQGRVLSADVVGVDPDALEEFDESDGRKVLSPGLAGRAPVEGLQQSGLTILGKFHDEPGQTMNLTITLNKELQGPGPVPARVKVDRDPEVHDLVFKRHAGLKIGHKTNYENVPGPVAKAKAPPEVQVEEPAGPVVKLNSPLHEAILSRNKAAVASLVGQGAAVNASDDMFGSTPLHLAAQHGHLEIAALLLDHKAVVDARDKAGKTPLHWATQSGHRDIVELLIAKGANVNAQDKQGDKPVILAPTKEIAKLLIDHGADVNARNVIGSTILSYAAMDDWWEVAELLIAKGAKINARNDLDRTPLHVAATREIAEVLIAHGADVNAKDEFGDTPLHEIAWRGRLWRGQERLLSHEAEVKLREVAEALLAHGADVNANNDDGLTPLHCAAGHGHLEVAETLIAHGAAVNAKDGKGRTPLKYVLLTLQGLRTQVGTEESTRELIDRYEAMAKLLREHGAKE
jgi:cytohesin